MQAKIQKNQRIKHRLWLQISIIFFALACFYMITANSAWAAHEITAHSASTNSSDIVERLSAFMTGSAGMISMDSIPAGTSGTVTLPVRLEQAKGIGTATIFIYYDASLLRVSGCVTNPDNLIDNVLCNENYAEAGVIPFNIVSTNGFSGDAIAVKINFEMIGTLNNPFVPRLEIRRSATDIRGVDIPIAVAEVNQIGAAGDTWPEILESILQIFLPIVLK